MTRIKNIDFLKKLTALTLILCILIPTSAVFAFPTVINITDRKVQHEFRHAADFGITGSWNKATAVAYKNAIRNHFNIATDVYKSTYRGQQVYVFINKATGIGAYTDLTGNFIGGWRFNLAQMNYHAINGSKLK